MSITLRFLGTSAAAPIPHARCECPQCAEAYAEPRLQRARSAVLIEAANQSLLVDAGPDIYRQLSRLARLPRISAAVITHTHSDHYLGLDDLAAIARSSGWLNDPERPFDQLLPVYAPPDNWPRIMATFGHLFRSGAFQCLHERMLLVDHQHQIAGLSVQPFDSHHTADVTTAMLAFELGGKRVVYASDLKLMPQALFAGADLAIVSGTFYERDHPAHMPLIKSIRACRRLGVGRILVTHVGHLGMSDAELSERLAKYDAQLAYDGMTISFK